MHLSWIHIVHIGGASLTFPLAGLIALRLVYLGLWKRACCWLLSLGAGAGIILAGKLAFELGGWSMPSANMYSVSGHAMLTAAVYPVLGAMLGSVWGRQAARLGVFGGICAAALVAVALVVGRYHTPAETLIGMAVGLAVAWINARPSRQLVRAGQMPLLARLALCGFLILVVPAALHPVKSRLWSHGMDWFGVTERYYRSIDTDPVSGRTIVTVEQCRLPSYMVCSESF